MKPETWPNKAKNKNQFFPNKNNYLRYAQTKQNVFFDVKFK